MQEVQATITRRETLTVTQTVTIKLKPDHEPQCQFAGKEKGTVMPLIIIVLDSEPEG